MENETKLCKHCKTPIPKFVRIVGKNKEVLGNGLLSVSLW